MKSKRLHNAYFVLLTNYLTKFSRDIILPSLPALAVMFHVSETELKFAVPLYFFGIMLSRVIWPPLADIYSRRHVMMLAGSVFCVATIASLIATTANVFLFARFIQAIGISGVPLIARSFIYKTEGADHVFKLYAFLGILLAWSSGIALALGGYLQNYFGAHSVLYFLLFFGLTYLIFARFILPNPKPIIKPEHQSLYPMFKSISTNYQFWLTALPFSLLMAGMAAYFTLSPFLFIHHFGLNAFQFGLLSFAVLSGLVLGKLFAGLLIDRYRYQQIIRAGILISLSSALALVVFDSALSIAILCGSYFIGVGMLNPTTKTAVMQQNPDNPATALSIQGFIEAGLSTLAGIIAVYITSSSVIYFGLLLSCLAVLSFIIATAQAKT